MKRIKNFLTIGILVILSTSCKSFLDEKPDQKLTVPTTLEDLQSLLDYYLRVGTYEPSVVEVVADDYYLEDKSWNSLPLETDRRLYTWEDSNVFPPNNNNWSYCYNTIYTANSVLEKIDDIIVVSETDRRNKDNIKGQALAIRGRMFMKLAFIWSPIYSPENNKLKLGIPLKLNTDFNEKLSRPTVEESYNQAKNDLLAALPLLNDIQVHPLRTSKAATYGLLSRLCLVMGEYENSLLFADSCLRINNDLIDYNDLNGSKTFPFDAYNKEVILGTQMLTPSMLAYTNAIVVSDIFNSYEEGDLRKSLYFKISNDNNPRYYGSYTGSYQLFDGIATDEVMLNRAESYVRLGKVSEAIDDLNSLLIKRWKKGLYKPYQVSSKEEVLSIIIKERRKSLLMRGIRWTDLKRYNRDGAKILVSRAINGKTYSLQPNDLRYALPIPEEVVELSGIQQNPR